MDTAFKDWLIKTHEASKGKYRHAFLWIIKFKPDEALQIISSELIGWTGAAAFKLRKIIVTCNDDQTCNEILKALQEHFAKEMESITYESINEIEKGRKKSRVVYILIVTLIVLIVSWIIFHH